MDCPVPRSKYPQILMAHGGGGRLSQQLFRDVFQPFFDHPELRAPHDGARISLSPTHPERAEIITSTDSFVIRPLFFPGGDIGSLAITGTVNDLAMCGAKPEALTVNFILEEGFSIESLQRIVQSMSRTAHEAGVSVVAGDTKVVERGKCDSIFISTTGIGTPLTTQPIHPRSIEPGDVILLSGDLGRHGIAVLASREGLQFETEIQSDCGLLLNPVLALIQAGVPVHCLRDLTRGGLSSGLVEIAETAHLEILVHESKIPVHPQVHAACEIMGFDPLFVANEGRMVVFVPARFAESALQSLRQHSISQDACVIGEVRSHSSAGEVWLKTTVGVERPVDMITGEQLPRIC